MDLMDQCGRIADDISQSHRNSVSGLVDIEAAENAINSAERALRDAESFIDVEGQVCGCVWACVRAGVWVYQVTTNFPT